MKMARMENKRISNNSLELRTPQPSLLKNTSSVLKWRAEREWERGLKGRRKSILNISFQSNVNNLCCLCFLLLLFIYLLLSFQQPAHFSKASWTGKLYQTFEFSFKRLSPCLFIYFSFFTLVLLLFGEAMKLWWEANLTRILLWWPQANANKEVSIKIRASFFFYSVFSHQNTLNGQLHAFTHPSINNRSNGSNNSTSPLMWKFVWGDSRCTWPWPPKERESGQVILFGTLNNSDFEKMKGESEMFLKKIFVCCSKLWTRQHLVPWNTK